MELLCLYPSSHRPRLGSSRFFHHFLSIKTHLSNQVRQTKMKKLLLLLSLFFSMETQIQKKPKILCLHGYNTSANILEKEITSKWPQSVLEKLDLVYLNGPFLVEGKAMVAQADYDPPYYKWFQTDESYKIYNFDECVAYLEDYMIKHGPFDGLLGFSQGAIVAASLPGIQMHGAALTKVPKIKSLFVISGAKFGGLTYGMPKLATNAYSPPIECLSLHFLGEKDFAKPDGNLLLEAFVNPIVINHPGEHGVPKLDEEATETMLSFIDKIMELP